MGMIIPNQPTKIQPSKERIQRIVEKKKTLSKGGWKRLRQAQEKRETEEKAYKQNIETEKKGFEKDIKRLERLQKAGEYAADTSGRQAQKYVKRQTLTTKGVSMGRIMKGYGRHRIRRSLLPRTPMSEGPYRAPSGMRHMWSGERPLLGSHQPIIGRNNQPTNILSFNQGMNQNRNVFQNENIFFRRKKR